MSIKVIFICAFALLAVISLALGQEAEPPAAEEHPAEAPAATAAPGPDLLPSFAICIKHTECTPPNNCYFEVIHKKKVKVCVSEEFHALPADVKTKLKYPAHLKN